MVTLVAAVANRSAKCRCMPRFGAEQLVKIDTVFESMTAVGTSNTSNGRKLPPPDEAPVERDQGATEVSNQTNSSEETFELLLLFNHGNEAVQEEDTGDVEVDDEDEEDEEGDVTSVSANRPNQEPATAAGGHASNSTVNDRRKKKRNRRRVRKRNTTSNTAAGNEVGNEGSHHSTNYVVEGVKPAIPSSPTKASATGTGTGTGNASSQQGQGQANQRSKKPHDAPMTKSDLYYSIRCEMVPVEVEVRQQSLPTVKSGQDSESSESIVLATIVRHVIGRVLLVNWDNVKVYDALVVPELSSSQLTLLQEEFKGDKSSQWTTATLPYTFQVKQRTMEDRSGPTGMESAANVSPLSISELKPILKKMVKGKIVIGYNVQADLQLIDGMAHPKTDVRDLAQCSAYMSTIVTARPMSLHFSQDRQSIVHREPKPLSLLIETFVESSNETTNPKLLHQGWLFKEAVACLFLYKRVRSEWEDELSRSSRFRYKFPPMVAKSNAYSTPGKSSTKEMSLLPPPVSQQPELWIPRPTQYHVRSPLPPQYGYDPSQPPSMMNILPGDRPNNRNNSLPMSSYHSAATTSSYVPVDRDVRAAQYKDRRHHPNHPIYPEYERWNRDHASTGALPVDVPGSLPSTSYRKPQLPVSSLAAVPPHARSYFGPNEYGTSPPTWDMQRHVETNRPGTERLATTNEGRRWLNAQEDLPIFHKSATSPREDPWRTTSSLHRPDKASVIPSPIISEQLPFSRIGTPNCLGGFDGVVHRNDRLPSTPAINTWSPLATESFSLLSILNKSSVTTAASDSAATQHMPPARAPTATATSVLPPTSNHHVFGNNEKDVSLMFEWSSLLASINDE